MTKFLTTWLVLFGMISAAPITNPMEGMASFHWENQVIDLGEIPQNQSVKAVFQFENSGDVPLVIQQATASCGCTVADYTREPIAPGKSGKVTVAYNAKSLGAFRKTVRIVANTNEGPVELSIQGTVK